ncbi:4-hydroxy-tetrahydrodipicolinate synthase [Lentisphaerota bacterium WC36G]|nr:4-hydroxy-tetrahydrodipicolinate synthase [Lentisphaerae bacterium WC36]
MELKGVYTALVTPFSESGKVDYSKLKELVKMQVAAGVSGIVPVGTTGESPTLSMDEHMKVIETTIDIAAGKVQIIAGTGANSTAEAVELTKAAKKAGADASLQVTPYYNKPSQEGLYRHFSIVAEESNLPIVLYNVPGRAGAEIALGTVKRLAENELIVAIKEAAGSVERVSEICDICDLTVLSGDDSLTLPMMSVGATGVISVASNIIPADMVAMLNAFENGDIAKARGYHAKYYRLFSDLFIETNPVPVKAALAMMNIIEEYYRLPLCVMNESNRDVLHNTLRKCGLVA